MRHARRGPVRPPSTTSISPGERVDAGVTAGGFEHLHPAPAATGNAIVKGPAPPAHRVLRARTPERGGGIEGRPQHAIAGKAFLDAFHHLAAEEVAAAPPLVEDRGVIEE